jgi:PAS domain S-box-containing protein
MNLDPTSTDARGDEHRDDGVHAQLLRGQRAILDRVAGDAPVDEVLEALVGLIEEQTGDMRCAVLLADPAQRRLRFAAAPNIPADYKAGIEPFLEVAPNMGSCGTAAFRRQPVYTRDTATDPLWENCGGIAVRNGLRAIWSTPILARDGALIGTFAMYYGEPRLPSEYHIGIIQLAVQLARLVVEGRRGDAAPAPGSSRRGELLTDLVGQVVFADAGAAELLGYNPEELRGQDISLLAPGEDHDELVRRLLVPGSTELVAHRVYQARDGHKMTLREHWTLRRNADGQARYVHARIEAAMATEQHPLSRLSTRERQVLTRVVAGQTSRQIAEYLGISIASVDTYRSRGMEKLGVAKLPGLIRFAIENGMGCAPP